jgi:outer membrane lipoprotein SlyB
MGMSRTNSILITAVALASFVCGQPGRSIPAGTIVQVRNDQTIDSKNAIAGQVFSGFVTHNVTDRRGYVVIPGGSPAELVVRNISKHEVALDLQAIMIAGNRYQVSSESTTIHGSNRSDLGANKRTAKFVGGGALGGSVIGAIGGGGAGAAIGAFAGAAAGATAQVLTKGKSVRVPAESLLTFRLTHPLRR